MKRHLWFHKTTHWHTKEDECRASPMMVAGYRSNQRADKSFNSQMKSTGRLCARGVYVFLLPTGVTRRVANRNKATHMPAPTRMLTAGDKVSKVLSAPAFWIGDLQQCSREQKSKSLNDIALTGTRTAPRSVALWQSSTSTAMVLNKVDPPEGELQWDGEIARDGHHSRAHPHGHGGFHCTVLVTAHGPALKTGIEIVRRVPSALASNVPGA